MKNSHSPDARATPGNRFVTCATALAVALTVSLPWSARAANVTPPPVPPDIEVPAGNKAFLVGHGVGTQDYVCLPSSSSSSGFAFTLFTPEATLFSDDDAQLTTHFFSPNRNPDPGSNPSELGAIRVTWQHSRDTSTVWAKLFHAPSFDRRFVAKNSVPWLVLQRTGALAGPDGGDVLSKTTFIQRLNTSGGVAPSIGCSQLSDVGTTAFIPYTADYFFYEAAE